VDVSVVYVESAKSKVCVPIRNKKGKKEPRTVDAPLSDASREN
jgi:hypothetical protein